MDALHAIATRRSVRRFTDAPLTEEQLGTVLHAAMAAPSASNGRSWRFVVVRDRDKLQRLSRATPFASPVAEAAACIVVCADRPTLKYPGFWVIDCSAAIENLLLAAHATGLGAVWLGVHPIAPFRYAVRRVIEAPATVVVHSMIAIGTPVAVPAPVDRYDGSFVHLECW